MKKTAKQRVLNLLLVTAMLLSFLPAGLLTTAEAAGAVTEKSAIDQSTYEALGFTTDIDASSESFLGSSTNGTKTTMYTKNELFLDYQSHKNYGWMLRDNLNFNHSSWTSYQTIGAYALYHQYHSGDYDKLSEGNGYTNGQLGGTVLSESYSSTGGHMSIAYKTAKEFRSSSGKLDRVAEIVVSATTKRSEWKATLRIYQAGTGGITQLASYSLGNAPALDEQGMIYNQYFDALYDIEAGDFDGDGIDEIAVYYGTNEVKIFDTGSSGNSLRLNQTISASELLKDTNISGSFNADNLGTVKRAAIVSLAAGDLKKDMSDDLVITVSMPQSSNTNAHQQNPYAYIYGYNGSALAKDREIRLYVDNLNGDTNKPQVFKAANAAIGDIDGDGCSELVIGGRLCSSTGTNDAGWNVGALIAVKYSHSSRSYTVGSATQIQLNEYDADKILTVTGTDQSLRYYAPVGMAIADLDGVGSNPAYTFFFSGLFTYNASTMRFDSTGQYLDTIKGQTNNVNEGEDKGQHWISDVVVGNFNGNNQDAQQIIAIVGCKEEGDTSSDDDWYWYYMSYMSYENGTLCAQCEGIVNQGRSYINRSDKNRASVFVAIACPDVDNDSLLLEHIGTETYYSKPEVQAVLQSAPYFSDVADVYDNYLNNGATTYGITTSTGEGGTASVEAALGIYATAEMSLFAQAEFEAEVMLATSYEHEDSIEIEKSIEYSGGIGDDYVVMYTIPYYRYVYNATDPGTGKKSIMFIDEPLEPSTVIIPVDTYDAIAAQTEGLEPIRGNILTSTPGDPSSYTTAPKGTWTTFASNLTLTNAGASNSETTASGSITQTEENSFSVGIDESLKVGGGVGFLGNGGSIGVSQSLSVAGGGVFSNMSGVGFSGTVDSLPTGVTGYAFNWDFGYTKTRLNDEDIIVVGYITKNVKQAPSLPRDISVTEVTSSTVTLEWSIASDAAMYEVYVSQDQNEWLPLESVPVTYANEAGVIYYTVKGLSAGDIYYFRVNACDNYGVRSLDTTPVSARTLSDSTTITLLSQPEDTSAALGKSAQFNVVAQGSGSATMYYQWYKRSPKTDGNGYGSWTKIVNDSSYSGATSPMLTVAAVALENNGEQYRCRVSQSANYLYSSDAMLTVSKSPSQTSLTITVDGEIIENGDSVTAASTSVTAITQQVVSWNEVVVNGYSKLAANETESSGSYTYTEPYFWQKDGVYYADNSGAVGAAYTQYYRFTDSTNSFRTSRTGSAVTATIPTTATEAEAGTGVSVTQQYALTDGSGYVYASADEETVYYAPTGKHVYTPEGGSETTVTLYSQVTLDDTVITVSGSDYATDSLVPVREKVTSETIIGYQTQQIEGDMLTLTASVNADDLTGRDKVSFSIKNTASGTTTTLNGTRQSNGKWTAAYSFTVTGIYQISASFNGNSTYFSSRSDETLIYVSSEAGTLSITGGAINYGQSLDLSPTIFSASGRTKLTSGVEYSVTKNGAAVTGLVNGNTFTPNATGAYVINASYTADGAVYTTSATIAVNSRTVTITAPDIELDVALSPAERKARIDALEVEIVGALESDLDAIKAAVTLYSAAAENIKSTGSYALTVSVKASSLADRYSFVLTAGTVTLTQDKKAVTAEAGSNGAVRISYTTTVSDSNGSYTSAPLTVDSGTLLPVGAAITVTAVPESGFDVDKWVVNGSLVNVSGTEYSFTLTAETNVNVYFSRSYSTLSFSAVGNGTVSGAYEGGGAVFNSGDSINASQTVVLTAEPNEGYAVSCWTKDGTIIRAGDGTSCYTGSTVTVTGVNKATEYKVYFEKAEEASVTVTFIHRLSETEQEAVDGCGVSFNGEAAEGSKNVFTYNTSEHDNVVITITIPDNMLVDYWEKDGKVVANAVEEISLYDISGDLHYIVYCETPNARVLTFGTELMDTNGGSVSLAGTLAAERNGSPLTSGCTLPQGAKVTFTASPADGYRVNKWIVNGQTVESVTSLTITDNTTVFVYFEKKPVVSINCADNGSANGFVDGRAMGGYVEFGDDVQIDITPDTGYVVDKVTVDGVDVTSKLKTPTGDGNADKRYYVIGDVELNTEVTVAFKAKPVLTITDGVGGKTVTDDIVGSTALGDFVNFGDDVRINIAPDKGYVVNTVTVNGNDVTSRLKIPTGDGNADKRYYVIEDINADVAVVITYRALTTTAVEISVIDKNGDDIGGENGTLTASVERSGIEAYEDSFTAAGSAQVYEGSTVTFAASPENGYRVSKWFVNGEQVSEQPTLEITKNMSAQTVQVQFDLVGESITYAVTGETDKAALSATFTAAGSTTPEEFISGNRPAANGVITLTAVVDDGYEIEGWYVNGEKQDTEEAEFKYSVTVGVGAELTVNIIRSSYTVYFTAVEGTVTAEAGGENIATGSSVVGDTVVTFTAQPRESTGYTFEGWSVNGEKRDETEETLTLTITENTAVRASYKLDSVKYAVSYGVIGENGTLAATHNGRSIGSSPAQVIAGSDITFTAAPAAGYRVAGWYADAEGTQQLDGTEAEQLTYETTNLVAALSVYVRFEEIPEYEISLSTEGLGDVTATVNGKPAEFDDDLKLTVKRYDKVVLTAVPDEYQYLVGWTVDGESVGNDITLTFESVTADISVGASFAASQLVELRTIVDTADGSIEVKIGYDEADTVVDPSTGIYVHRGQTVVLTVKPNDDRMVSEWIVNGESLGEYLDHVYTIEAITEDTTVEVVFEPLKLHSIPDSTEQYTIEVVEELPVDLGTQTQVRDRGTITFNVVPVSPNAITEVSVNGGEGSESEITLNRDGSWTVTVKNVRSDITFDPITVVSGKQLIVNCGEGGTVDVTLDGESIPSGRALTVGAEIKITAAADAGFRLDKLTVNEQLFASGGTYTVTEEIDIIAVDATFVSMPSGGGIGGAPAPAESDIIVEETENGKVTVEPEEKASSGDEVIITTEPDPGYKTGTVTVTDENGNRIEVTRRDDGSYSFIMPDGDVTIKAAFIVDFIDVSDDSYYSDAVDWAVENGITVGTSQNMFSPNLICTRAQAVTFLWRAAGSPEPESEDVLFEDVSEDAYYYQAVLWAAENGITVGVTESTFRPGMTCSRTHIVTFLFRYAAYQGMDAVTLQELVSGFADAEQVPDYALPAYNWAVAQGIVQGYDGRLMPQAPCTRAQIVTMLYRLLAE